MGAPDYWVDSPRPPYHMSTHDVGVHRMGEDPRELGHRPVRRGLFAVGGGLFPAYGGYNPTLTLQALSYWSAEQLLRERGAWPPAWPSNTARGDNKMSDPPSQSSGQ
ncbi:MAG: hypothetical protein M3N43_08235 [Actinomycetota bacterium]|nr:hypothetical protein [Actinomycetota bacterium]